MGTIVHDALARIADATRAGLEVDIDLIASTAGADMRTSLLDAADPTDRDALTFAAEQGTLVEGMIRGFYRQVWPGLMTAYPTILAVEQEMTYQVSPGVAMMTKPDLVVQALDGSIWYVEYKSTSSNKQDWINSWQTAVQLHSGIRAVEQTLGVEVTGVIVQGLYKGYVSYGRQNSPFCYAYVRGGQPPFIADRVSYEYASGFRRMPTWELPGGVGDWVAGMPEVVLSGQFPQTPPIYVKGSLIDRFLAQVDIRERAIRAAKDTMSSENELAVMDATFPQNFDKCQPSWGRPCRYRILCHGSVNDPLDHGYQVRESHHEAEREQHAGTTDSVS